MKKCVKLVINKNMLLTVLLNHQLLIILSFLKNFHKEQVKEVDTPLYILAI